MNFLILCLILANIEAVQVDLSLARSNLAATSVNELAIFAGGNSGTTQDLDATIDIFNSNGILVNTTYLSVARLDLAATAVNDLAIFAGGNNVSTVCDTIDIYNSVSGSWTTNSLSEPRTGLSATTINDLALFGGGLNSNGLSDRVDMYNATSGSWTTASLSEPRYLLVSVSVGNYALFGGGANSTGSTSSRVDIYDATSGTWETASLSEPRNWFAAASAGELAAFGGGQINASALSSRVDIFNATSKKWSTASLSHARSYFAATSVGNLIIFGSGSDGDYLYTPVVDILDTRTNTWTTTTMNPARGSLAATSFGNLAFFGGGYMNQDGNVGPASAVNIFSLCNNGTVTQQVLDCNPATSRVWIYILVSSICGALIVVNVIIFLTKRRRNGYSPITQSPIRYISDVSIQERLGGGQFGDVYRGTMEEGVEVALKKLKSDTDLKEFEREAEILCALNHPNIVRFFGIHKSQLGQKYIVLEYMSEGSLNHFLQRTQLQLYDLLLFSKHVIAGMRYLGENHIVHRDLACRNLLVATQERKFVVKVGDFGMSRSVEKGYYTNNEAKIPYKWSAPELIQYGTSTVKGDVWSFGICLWEIFSLGKTPYATWTNQELIPRVISGERLEQPENCPNEVYELMQSCWKLDPNVRPSFEELAESLQQIINELQGSYSVGVSVLALPSGSTTEMNVYN